MSQHDTSPQLSDHRRSRRCDRGALVAVAVSLLVASGCGAGPGALFPQTSIEIITGKDSAGATIELEKRGADFAAARVIDGMLGTGEGEIIPTTDGGIEFTIEFPAGATITYLGSVQSPSTSRAQAVAGTWVQHAEGIFGEDTGTWETAAYSVQETDR